MREQYYEGILQIRNPKQEAIDYIHRDIAYNADQKVKITKMVEHKNGIDIYLTSQKYAQAIAKRLHNEFGGSITLSSRVHTRDTKKNKDLKRISILYVIPEFSKNDVVEIKSRAIKITGIHKMVTGIDIESGKRVAYEYKNIKPVILQQVRSTVSRIYPSLQVLDPETYQPVNVKNKKNLKVGQKIKLVKINNKILLV